MADETPLEDPTPRDRRRFFAEGLARLLGPVASYLEEKLPHLPIIAERLRPPGALEEAEFLDTCLRCGNCADVCPVEAIVLTTGEGPKLDGTPYIEPARNACVLCNDLSCMRGCPSGALRLVDLFAIRMGLAEVNHDVCVRSKGESCRECIDKCPIAETAIRLDGNGRVEVIDPKPTGRGCTGCGVCEQYCPTRPLRAIRVMGL